MKTVTLNKRAPTFDEAFSMIAENTAYDIDQEILQKLILCASSSLVTEQKN